MKDVFLALVRLGIGNAAAEKLPNHIDWDEVESLAERQGLLGVVYDGGLMHTDPSTSSGQVNTELLPLTVKLRWMGKVMQEYEQRYALYRKAVADLGGWYQAHGYRMMLLKGLACGMDWPRPEHRPYGDIDIYLFGQYKEADAQMVQEFKVVGRADGTPQEFKVDNSHHHHSVFNWQGFTVENHYDFVNIHHHKSNNELEKIFKELAFQDTSSILQHQPNICLPSPNLHSLFLIKHLVSHFASEQITIRQLLDWAFFVKIHCLEIDWVWLEKTLEQYGMMPFYKIINAICVDDLGFDLKIFPIIQFEPNIKERVLKEILSPEFSEKEPKHVWKRIPYKYRRWKANEWKHKMCYNESMGSAFWYGVKNHLLKPASI